MTHSHPDREIKTCKICQSNLAEIKKAGTELDKLGVWRFPKKIKANTTYGIWKRR